MKASIPAWLSDRDRHACPHEQRLAEFEQIAGVGSWEWDIATNWVLCSEELHRIYGAPFKDRLITYARFLEQVHPDDRLHFKETIQRAFETREAFSIQHRILRPDGQVRHLHARGRMFCDEGGEPQRLVGTAQDVTERQLLEGRLKASEERLRAIIEHTSDAIYAKDHDGRLILANPAEAAIFGLSVDELIGKRDTELVDAESIAKIREHDRMVLETGEVRTVEESGVIDGIERIFSSTKFPFRAADGRIIGVAGISREITSHKQMERALQHQYERLKQLDQMKNSLVTSVSHELRTPLTSIRGFAEFLEDEVAGALTPEQAEFVAQIQAGAARLQTLVDDLLDFSRLESGSFKFSMELIDLTAKMREVVESFRPQALERQLTLEAHLPDQPLIAHADGRRIEQVLINLIGNAMKFTPSEGHITVRLRQEGENGLIEVEDTGIGISAKDVPHLFDRFYQTDRGNRFAAAGGVGLGLSISKAIVEAHGGRMGVHSELDKGSTFWFALPLSEASP